MSTRSWIAMAAFIVGASAFAEGGGQGTRGGYYGCTNPFFHIPGYDPCAPDSFGRVHKPNYNIMHFLAVDQDGTLFKIETVTDANGRDHWTTRRSTDEGKSWEVVDDFVTNLPGVFGPSNIVIEEDGRIFVSGREGGRIQIRVSEDHGRTWTSPPDFQN